MWSSGAAEQGADEWPRPVAFEPGRAGPGVALVIPEPEDEQRWGNHIRGL